MIFNMPYHLYVQLSFQMCSSTDFHSFNEGSYEYSEACDQLLVYICVFVSVESLFILQMSKTDMVCLSACWCLKPACLPGVEARRSCRLFKHLFQ